MSGLAIAGTAVPAILTPGNAFGNAKEKKLKIGLIGCGGRGTGAANQALKADPDVVLHAMGDVFEDKLKTSLDNLSKIHGDKVKVKEKRQFLGFDAYQKVLESGVDVVILATPPGFRPQHLAAAVEAEKHIFCEKPVAVDAPGIRKVLEAARKAGEKNLSLVSGFCWRYHTPKRAIFEKVLGGAVGDISTIYNSYNTSALWSHPRQAGWTDMEYQLRNWPYYAWLSGDHIVEQAVHCIDMMNWAMGGKLPVSAMGTGGRQVRTDDVFGHIYDHFAITYEYENGARGFHFSRQQQNCQNSYDVEIFGDKGRAVVDCSRNFHEIQGANQWKFTGEQNDMYQTEHDELFASIRQGKPINDGEYMAHSSMLAIMGRMAAYTGRRITWEEAINSTEVLGTDVQGWKQEPPVVNVAMPGITEFI
ncbi:Gfo/Idh/MocA family oxidoreductase [Anseongella ginsenosidimutans]|nr:Gfo/Idh/MocA family oxidoreductase [Anseongella ginsenosidimutans]